MWNGLVCLTWNLKDTAELPCTMILEATQQFGYHGYHEVYGVQAVPGMCNQAEVGWS